MGSCCSSIIHRSEVAAAKQAENKKMANRQLSAKRQKQHLRNNLVNQSAVVNWDSIEENYEIVQQLGVGSMGSVASVRRKVHHNNATASSSSSHTSRASSQLYAMKTLRLGRLTQEFEKELENEIRIVSDLDHPGIVKFHHVFRMTSVGRRGKAFIIMDLCQGGDLYQRDPYREAQAADILHQLLSAVAYMHSRSYVHRDLKVRYRVIELHETQII
jgi:serine/threonine protein kinase